MNNSQRIAQLILKQLKGELDAPETDEINEWISQSEANQLLYRQLTDPEELQPEVMAFHQSKRNIFEKIQAAIPAPKVIPLWKKVMAAASIIFVLGFSSYLLFFNNKTGMQNEIVKTGPIKDVEAPKSTKAMITLADGRTIALDSIASGTLTIQGNVNVMKTASGKIVYNGSAKEVVYNTLTNPKGSTVIDMKLADGSQVWLNAGSSVTYPVAFVGKERKVSITGEAYFEVAHNTAMPFKVSKGEMEITVVGTHFNVNAYDDESDIKVTLLEGAVKVINGSAGSLLKPGQQAQVTNEVKVMNGADLEQVIAWKNGVFKMKGTDLAALMRQVARWYDVQVSYEGPLPQKSFGGSIDRDVNLSDVLKALEQYGIRSRMEKGKVIIQ